jgi:PhnB protein
MSFGEKESDMLVQPYLSFNGKCEEAIEFYRKAIGAEVEMLMRFKDAPDKPPPGMVPANWDNKVMHACMKIGDAQVMASDGCGAEGPAFKGITLSLSVDSEADADKKFAGLSQGGQVTMPLGKTFFSPRFGMLTDKFGVSWMVLVPGEIPAQAAA